MLLFLLTVLNCPIINVTHCKKIHNNYCVPVCIYFYWRNKQTLPSKFIMIFNQSDSSDVEVSGEEDEDSCSMFCLFLTRYFNTSFFISSFSLISSLVDFPFLLFFDFFFLDFSHFLATFLAQWSLTSSSSWTATKDRDEEGLGIGLELQGFTGDNAGSGRSSLFSSALDALGGAPTAQLFFCSFSFSGFDWLEQAVYVDSTVLFSMEKITSSSSLKTNICFGSCFDR